LLKMRNRCKIAPLILQSTVSSCMIRMDVAMFHLGMKSNKWIGSNCQRTIRKKLVVFTITPTGETNEIYRFEHYPEVTPPRYRIRVSNGDTAAFITIHDLKARLRNLGFRTTLIDTAVLQLCEEKNAPDVLDVLTKIDPPP